LFAGIKMTEALFHLRPRALYRLIAHSDERYLQIMRDSMWTGMRVVLAEILEFFLDTKFIPQGSMDKIIGSGKFRQESTPLG
jgi:hypothetical protein